MEGEWMAMVIWNFDLTCISLAREIWLFSISCITNLHHNFYENIITSQNAFGCHYDLLFVTLTIFVIFPLI